MYIYLCGAVTRTVTWSQIVSFLANPFESEHTTVHLSYPQPGTIDFSQLLFVRWELAQC